MVSNTVDNRKFSAAEFLLDARRFHLAFLTEVGVDSRKRTALRYMPAQPLQRSVDAKGPKGTLNWRVKTFPLWKNQDVYHRGHFSS
jgi:hypothetical protein